MNLNIDTWGCPCTNSRDEITGKQNSPIETSAKAISLRSTSAGDQNADRDCWRGREFSVVHNNEIHPILSPSTPKCWLISRKRSRVGITRNKLKPEPCSLYHRIESTVDQQYLVSVKHSGLSLRQREVNALRQSLPFLLGRAWNTAGELKAGTCFYLSDTPALWDGAGKGWKR